MPTPAEEEPEEDMQRWSHMIIDDADSDGSDDVVFGIDTAAVNTAPEARRNSATDGPALAPAPAGSGSFASRPKAPTGCGRFESRNSSGSSFGDTPSTTRQSSFSFAPPSPALAASSPGSSRKIEQSVLPPPARPPAPGPTPSVRRREEFEA